MGGKLSKKNAALGKNLVAPTESKTTTTTTTIKASSDGDPLLKKSTVTEDGSAHGLKDPGHCGLEQTRIET